MPYIAVNVSKALSDMQKETIKTALGQKISVIPGKVEKGLMVDISDGRTMYFGGVRGDFAYLDVKIYGAAEADAKAAFIAAASDVMADAGFEKRNVYITLSEFANWGVGGKMV